MAHRVIGDRAVVQTQLPLLAGSHSVPEPDVAVLPGTLAGNAATHPARALLVVEVADSSLAQDRLTKRGIYAAAGVPEYWVVNLLLDEQIEVHREPRRAERRYAVVERASRGARLDVPELAGVAVAVDDLLPPPAVP